MSKKDGGPAFPIQGQAFTIGDSKYEPTEPGMTLRDYFAAKAMQAICTNIDWGNADRDDLRRTAQLAYEQADAMLWERDK